MKGGIAFEIPPLSHVRLTNLYEKLLDALYLCKM